jgi:hypothetical protein
MGVDPQLKEEGSAVTLPELEPDIGRASRPLPGHGMEARRAGGCGWGGLLAGGGEVDLDLGADRYGLGGGSGGQKEHGSGVETVTSHESLSVPSVDAFGRRRQWQRRLSLVTRPKQS